MPDTTRPDRYGELVRRLHDAVLGSRGAADQAVRRAIEARAGVLGGRSGTGDAVPTELSAFVDRVARQAYAVSDLDIAALRQAGYSEDAIFEITACAAVGAGLARLERGLAVLAEGKGT